MVLSAYTAYFPKLLLSCDTLKGQAIVWSRKSMVSNAEASHQSILACLCNSNRVHINIVDINELYEGTVRPYMVLPHKPALRGL